MNQAVAITSIKKVAIVDDQPECVNVEKLVLEEAGFEPIYIEPKFAKTTDSLINKIREVAEGAICDHRLQHGGYSGFFGAEVVARLYAIKIPALLVTQYLDQDYDNTIRKWRRSVPVLIARDNIDSELVRSSLLACQREFQEGLPDSRKPRTSLVRIENIVDGPNSETFLDVILPNWNTQRAVRLPKSLLPKDLHSKVAVGARFIADVNIGAENKEDLFFEKFRLAKEPNPNDGLA